jgi:trans-aconitate methyltransferase
MDRFTTVAHSQLYAKYRPATPACVVDCTLNFLRESIPEKEGKWDVAVDVGCGPGQSIGAFTKHFKKLYGFDVSQSQIDEAKLRNFPNVEFKVTLLEIS